MGEPELGRVVGQALGRFAIVEKTAFGGATPGAQMNLVDTHGAVRSLVVSALSHPGAISPASPRGADDRFGDRGVAECSSERISPRLDLATRRRHVVSVPLPDPGAANTSGPHATAASGEPPSTGSKLADDPHSPCPRRPDGEGASSRIRMGAEIPEQGRVLSGAESGQRAGAQRAHPGPRSSVLPPLGAGTCGRSVAPASTSLPAE